MEDFDDEDEEMTEKLGCRMCEKTSKSQSCQLEINQSRMSGNLVLLHINVGFYCLPSPCYMLHVSS